MMNVSKMHKFFILIFYFMGILGFLHAENEEPHFHICTVASYDRGKLERLNKSCQKHKIELVVLGFKMPYLGNGTKLIRVKDYVNGLNDQDIVLFVDAFDVIITEDKDFILQKFLSKGSNFIMSTEKNCHPFPDLALMYPSSPTPFKYINSGGFIGYVKNIKKWLNNFPEIQPETSDQGQITLNYLKDPQFDLDHECDLFLSLYRVEDEEVSINFEHRKVRCLTTQSEPCVIHANGRSFTLLNKIYENFILK